MLQEAEVRLVAASVAIDSTFRAYVPQWPDSFDVVDTESASSGLVEIGNISHLTLTQRKIVLHAATRVLDSMTRITDDQREAIREEIEALTDEDFSFRLPAPDIDAPANDVE